MHDLYTEALSACSPAAAEAAIEKLDNVHENWPAKNDKCVLELTS